MLGHVTDGGGSTPGVVCDLHEADGRAEFGEMPPLGQRLVAEQELRLHAPAHPLEEGRPRQVFAAHQHTGEVAFRPHHRRSQEPHEQAHAIALGRGHAAPVAAEGGDVELAGDQAVVVGKAGGEAAHAVPDPVDGPPREGAMRPIEHARDIEGAPVAHAHLRANERAAAGAADAPIVEGEDGVSQLGQVGGEPCVVAALHRRGAADHDKGGLAPGGNAGLEQRGGQLDAVLRRHHELAADAAGGRRRLQYDCGDVHVPLPANLTYTLT